LIFTVDPDAVTIIAGTPKSIMPKIRKLLETLGCGIFIVWDGDGAMTHEDQMRSLRLYGEHVLPAIREIGKELGLTSSDGANASKIESVGGAAV